MKIGDRIYLDHQATTPVDPVVLEAMLPYFTRRFGNPHATDHSIGWDAAKAVDTASEQVAELIGSDPDEIIFVSGATEANNLALKGLVNHPNRKTRNRILISKIEHKSVLETARQLRDQHGFVLTEIPVTSAGIIETSTLDELLTDDVLVTSIGLVNGEIGSIQPLETLSTLVRERGALLHTDAAQAPLALDLKKYGALVDMLSLSAHKMYGPQGIGALFVERSLQQYITPTINGGGQQHNLRSGTLPIPLCVGIGRASTIWSASEAKHLRAKIATTRNEFVQRLLRLNWPIQVNGPNLNSRHPGNANIQFQQFDAHSILAALQPTVAASQGSACSSGIQYPSHVLRNIGLNSAQSGNSIRFSFGKDTTLEDVVFAIDCLHSALTTNSLSTPAEEKCAPSGQSAVNF